MAKAAQKGKKMKRRFVLLMTLSLWVLSVSGCASTQPTKFYLLSSLTKQDVPAQSKVGTSELTLGIGPINLPKYLDRPQIVTRASRNALTLAEFHKWAEQLEDNLAHVIAENLSILLGTDRVEFFPWRLQRSIDYQLILDVIQFDRNEDGEAVLLSRWSLIDEKGRPLIKGKKSRVTATPNGQDYESLVQALSATLADLSREIAGVIQSLGREKTEK